MRNKGTNLEQILHYRKWKQSQSCHTFHFASENLQCFQLQHPWPARIIKVWFLSISTSWAGTKAQTKRSVSTMGYIIESVVWRPDSILIFRAYWKDAKAFTAHIVKQLANKFSRNESVPVVTLSSKKLYPYLWHFTSVSILLIWVLTSTTLLRSQW